MNMEENQIENIDEQINSEIHKESYTKIIQSQKKMGINNPNYGQKLSDSHALNISIATTNAKRANNPNLTNDKIREIYALKGLELQMDVAKKYNLHRNMIRQIWNKTVIPTDDPKFLTKKQELIISNKSGGETDGLQLTNDQRTSLGKRTLSSDEYFEIIQWKIKREKGELLDGKKIFTTKLAEYLSTLWNKKVSNDIIKNIWSGKTKLFDFEFQNKDISYEQYLEIIKAKDI